MNYFLFLYSIVLTLLFGAGGFGFTVTSRRLGIKRDLWIAVMFFLFTLDNIVIFMAEFVPGFSEIFRSNFILFSYINHFLAMGMLYSYRMIIAHEFSFFPSMGERILLLTIAVALVFFTGFPETAWGPFAYHLLDQGTAIAITLLGFYLLKKRKASMLPRAYKSWRLILTVSLVTHLMGALERGAFILGYSLTGTTRVIGFEIFGLFCSCIAIWYLLMRLSRPVVSLTDEELFKLFIHSHGLTPREAELVPFLMDGAPNSEICDKLCISLNTVKVHTHNIYQKLDIERRSQMAVKYKDFVSSRQKG